MSTQDHSLDPESQKEKQIQALKKELDSVNSEARDMAQQLKHLRSELAALSNERDNDRSAVLETISRIEMERDLILLQVHQVQEELEYFFNLSMESDLILLQLHQVQEELEYFFNLSSKQAKSIEACAESQNQLHQVQEELEYFSNLSSKQAQLIEACAEFQDRFLSILPKLL